MGFKIEYKFCPQCQKPLSTDAEGNPHCASCDITIYNNVVAGAVVVLVRDGKVLLERRAREPFKGTLDLVGGFIKPGETPAEAAIREAKEETGLDVKITGLLGLYSDKYGDGAYTLGVHYLGEIVGGHPQAADDAASLEWLGIDDITDELLAGSARNVHQTIKDLRTWYHKQAQG